MKTLTFDELDIKYKQLADEIIELEEEIIKSDSEDFKHIAIMRLYNLHEDLVRTRDAKMHSVRKSKFKILKQLFKR